MSRLMEILKLFKCFPNPYNYVYDKAMLFFKLFTILTSQIALSTYIPEYSEALKEGKDGKKQLC